MAQIFHPSMNVISKVSIWSAVLGMPTLFGLGYLFNQSYAIQLKTPLDQPVQFSHKHHVLDDGIECRYCHNSVDKSAYAGVPATEVCMSCHSQIWSNSPLLEPVRESFRSGRPIKWARVHDLPDFVYFNHSVHVKKGIGCVSCHGRVDQMPITYKENDLTMRWCLNCHRNPEAFIRPREHVYDLAWTPKNATEASGKALVEKYHLLNKFQMTNCSTCHH